MNVSISDQVRLVKVMRFNKTWLLIETLIIIGKLDHLSIENHHYNLVILYTFLFIK